MNGRRLGLLLLALAGPAHAQAPWFQRTDVRDVTGDGAADTLRLVARGTRPDALRITFTIRTGGRIAYQASWSSNEYFDAPVDPAENRDMLMSQFEGFFGDDNYDRLGRADSIDAFQQLPSELCGDRRAVQCPADLVARTWSDLTTSGTVAFTFFSGGEYTRTIAWSPRAQRFYIVFACC